MLPLRRLVGAAQLFEHRGARSEQPRAPFEGAIGVELRDVELLKRALGLAEIEACPRHGDRQLHTDRSVQRGAVHRATHLEGAVGAADAPLAVDHERDLVVASRDAPVGAQLAQRESEIARRIGRDRERLPDDRDAPGTSRRRQCMLVRQRGVLVDELRRHRQVARDLVGVLLAQRLQLVACAVGRSCGVTSSGMNGSSCRARTGADLPLTHLPIGTVRAATRRTRAALVRFAVPVARRVRTVAIALLVRLAIAAVARRVRLPIAAVARRVGFRSPSRDAYGRSPSRFWYGLRSPPSRGV